MIELPIDRYRRLFDYEKSTQLKLLQSLRDASEAGIAEDQLQKGMQLLSHIMLGRRLWLHRLGIGKFPSFRESVSSLAELQKKVDEVQAEWSEYMKNLRNEMLQPPMEYTSTDGEVFETSIEDILTQLFGHGVHHAAQIAFVLRESGFAPPAIDFIFHARRKKGS